MVGGLKAPFGAVQKHHLLNQNQFFFRHLHCFSTKILFRAFRNQTVGFIVEFVTFARPTDVSNPIKQPDYLIQTSYLARQTVLRGSGRDRFPGNDNTASR